MTNIISKVFQNKCPHSGPCIPIALSRINKIFISNAKYYAPILILSMITKMNKMSPEVFKKAFYYYMECTVGGFSLGWSIITLVCLIRYLLGKHYYYTFIYLPSLIGALNILWLSYRPQHLFCVTITQCTLETLIIHRNNILTRSIYYSKFLQTLIFMSGSALILHAKQNGNFKGFWLLKPNKLPTKNESNETEESETKLCTHEEKSCNWYLLKGLKDYLAIGLLHDVAKSLVKKAPKDAIGFLPKFFGKLRKFKIESTAVLPFYIGIYRFTNCFLNRQANANLPRNHIIASFLSGICYLYEPNFTLLCFCIITSIETLYFMLTKRLETQEKLKNKFLENIKRFPFGKVIFPFGLAYLIHSHILHEKGVSNLAAIVIDNHTNFVTSDVISMIKNYGKELSSI